ncbi:YceI family protein [Candidatus Vondammii sp. HM_W22]|uniref:YceI family protein n=1 Tax=Candidatus Vondammii sp. HM_W22 TaxID=2687299 RepID=UPI001F140CF8|nr:YceI family protein [Candidatus Vondammii sp. HM_W22]
MLKGQFNKLNGSFEYDEKNPGSASIEVEVDMASVDSNHAERDKHLRSKDFLGGSGFPKASFRSTSLEMKGVKGDLTLHGVTRQMT